MPTPDRRSISRPAGASNLSTTPFSRMISQLSSQSPAPSSKRQSDGLSKSGQTPAPPATLALLRSPNSDTSPSPQPSPSLSPPRVRLFSTGDSPSPRAPSSSPQIPPYDGMKTIVHKRYLQAILDANYLVFSAIDTQAHDHGTSFFYQPNYNDNELLMSALQLVSEGQISRMTYVNKLLSYDPVLKDLNSQEDLCDRVLEMLFNEAHLSRDFSSGNAALIKRVKGKITNPSFLARFIQREQIFLLMRTESSKRVELNQEYQANQAEMTMINLRFDVLKAQDEARVTLQNEQTKAWSKIEGSAQMSKKFSFCQEEDRWRRALQQEQQWVRDSLRPPQLTGVLSITAHRAKFNECEPADDVVKKNHLRAEGIERVPQSTDLESVRGDISRQIGVYMSWRRNKSQPDGRGYALGWFSRWRHYSSFGEQRANRLLVAVGSVKTLSELSNTLQDHFKHDSRLHHHSLDTYLLEAITKHRGLFGLAATPSEGLRPAERLVLQKQFLAVDTEKIIAKHTICSK